MAKKKQVSEQDRMVSMLDIGLNSNPPMAKKKSKRGSGYSQYANILDTI